MSLFSRRILVPLLLGLFVVGHSSTARAWQMTDPFLIAKLWQYSNSNGYIFLDGYNCTLENTTAAPAATYFVLNRTDSEFRTTMSLLTAAFLAAKKVRLDYVSSGGYCVIQSVQIEK